jgi:signal transduction histidine kinase
MKALHAIQRDAKAMRRTIEDLLDEPDPVDLVAVIQGALADARLSVEVGGLHVTVTCHAASVAVAGDPLRLQQIVAHLLSNAITLTPPGGHVAVQLRAAASGVALSVGDAGPGISAEFLALVRALVERHGGTVQAASRGLGRGATFTVQLPGPRSTGHSNGSSSRVE